MNVKVMLTFLSIGWLVYGIGFVIGGGNSNYMIHTGLLSSPIWGYGAILGGVGAAVGAMNIPGDLPYWFARTSLIGSFVFASMRASLSGMTGLEHYINGLPSSNAFTLTGIWVLVATLAFIALAFYVSVRESDVS